MKSEVVLVRKGEETPALSLVERPEVIKQAYLRSAQRAD
jgi:hypothetical protein